MLIAPENIELNKIVKKRKLNFDTANRMYGNLVIVATESYDDYVKIFTSKLFKPQQLYSIYTPRKIKPLNRTFITYIQKDIYADIREKTGNFLKIGKALLSSYAGRNLVYNIIPEYYETSALYKTIKGSSLPAVHMFLSNYLQNEIFDITEMVGYEKSYLIFPMTRYIEEFRRSVQTDTGTDTSPVIEFLKTLRKKTFDKTKYANISRILFVNPNSEAMVVMDPQDPELMDDYLTYFDKINRLNKANSNPGELDDIAEEDVASTASNDDVANNTKEQIKDIVLRKVAKEIKANLNDYDAATTEEQGLITAIDKKIDNYLDDADNVSKPFSELVDHVFADKEIHTKANTFIANRQISEKQMQTLAKNLDAETDVVQSIPEIAALGSDIDLDSVNNTFEPEKISVDSKNVRNEVKATSLTAFDRVYNEVQAPQDLLAVLTAFSDQPRMPLTLDKYQLVDTSDDFTFKKTLSVRYKTTTNKTLSFKIDIPDIINDHCIKVKNVTYIIQKQSFRLPIIKTKTDRVEISSNLNKMTCSRTNGNISRKNTYLKKVLPFYQTNPNIDIRYGDNSALISSYSNDFEFEEMSTFLDSISNINYFISTERNKVEDTFSSLNYPESFNITKDMTPVGFALYGIENKNLLFIRNGELYEAIQGDTVKIIHKADSLFDLIMSEILHDNPDKAKYIGNSYIYSNCKYLTVKFPIFILTGLCVGMTSVLRKAKIRWKFSKTRLPFDIHYVEVKFKNGYFYYENKTENTLLLNILYSINTDDYNFEEFDTTAPYTEYCSDILGQPYAKQTVDFNISKMIDPITRDVLKHLHYPTDIVDLLIMANKMLTSNSYISQNDLCNYRIRGNEVIYAVLYQIIADAITHYQNAKQNGSAKDTLDINQNRLIATLIKQPNISGQSILNPVLEIESSASCSSKGFRGINLGDAYTMELRSYNPSMNGILSTNSTPFGGSVGITRTMAYNPKISTVRGFIPTIDAKKLGAENRLSAAELLAFTTATRSDPPRVAMEVGQSKHGVPVHKTTIQLLGSGMDRTIAYMISDKFCFKAKFAGTLDSVDEQSQVAILKYDNGTYDAIDLKETLWKNLNSGFYINQEYSLMYNVGDRFNKGDVIAYNPSFFAGKGADCYFKQGTLAKVAITAGDFVFEDSTYCTEKLCNWLASDITNAKAVAIGKNAIIHNISKIGDHVSVNEELMNFTTSFDDPTTTKFIQDLMANVGEEAAAELGNEKILSKYAGRISDIRILYNVPFEELSESLQKLINDYNSDINKRKKLLSEKGIRSAAINLKTIGQVKDTKYEGTEFDGVLIVFYITHEDKLGAGDKITYGPALKGVLSVVCPDEQAPFSEFRENEEICGLTSSTGVPGRMCEDIFPQLYGNKLLIELGRWIHKTWNED